MAKKNYSGKFVVRIDPNLHRRLSETADKNNLSLNAVVANALSASVVKKAKKDLVS